jgi:hypothetical protein
MTFFCITIQLPDMHSFQTSISFSKIMPMTRTNKNDLNNIQQKLAALTVCLEKEIESEATVDEYYDQCTKWGQPVTGSSDAYQVLDELYHHDC